MQSRTQLDIFIFIFISFLKKTTRYVRMTTLMSGPSKRTSSHS